MTAIEDTDECTNTANLLAAATASSKSMSKNVMMATPATKMTARAPVKPLGVAMALSKLEKAVMTEMISMTMTAQTLAQAPMRRRYFQDGEECDDGNAEETDARLTTCVRATAAMGRPGPTSKSVMTATKRTLTSVPLDALLSLR